MEATDDIVYLKLFVKKHPDNQMGWYLLGRKYKELGKEGKANYCFLQAGEIYEAFEDEMHPMANLAQHEQQMKMLVEWSRKQRKRKLVRRTSMLTLLVLLIALFIPNVIKEGEQTAQLPTGELGSKMSLGVVLVEQAQANPVGAAWNQLLETGLPAADFVIAAKLEEKDGWRSWLGSTRMFMTVENHVDGAMEVKLLDRYLCQCEPGSQLELYKQFKQWSSQQEQHWTLASAIIHYERMKGSWPSKLEDLVQPYPNNYLSGDSQELHNKFNAVLKKIQNVSMEEERAAKAEHKDQAVYSKEAAILKGIGTNGLYANDWSKPLEIVVDKESHQLAVVQGNIIIRSYKVGLGDSRTPEGKFFISEKVRNPNGRDDGEFGSRGMTLSDTLYAIHGTDNPDSIGKDESLGCIRMLRDDVEELFDMVPLGTTVTINNGTLPSSSTSPDERFKLKPRQDETNPAKVYRWL